MRSAGRPSPVALTRGGPHLVTTLDHARQVLTDALRFDFPLDVSREPIRGGRRTNDETTGPRTPHTTTPALGADAVARGMVTFVDELDAVSRDLEVVGSRPDGVTEIRAMTFLRAPVARSTTDAVLPGLDPDRRDRVGDLVLAWIDALAPVIAGRRAPGRWSRRRRTERACRAELRRELADLGCPRPAATATVLAAGIQVPIAAGAWLLVLLAEHPAVAEAARQDPDLAPAVVWETIRIRPPTWLLARITTEAVRLGESTLPAAQVVLVSPLVLGRLEELVPGPRSGFAALHEFDPDRWRQGSVRPGRWLPFGAGPHACPGRNLGIAQLTHLTTWAAQFRLEPVEPVAVDSSRGLFPHPDRLRVQPVAGPRIGGLPTSRHRQNGAS